jgi:hypothetical protein
MEQAQKIYKYNCDKCSYFTDMKLSFERHLKSTLHITGKRKSRTDKKHDILNCDKCDYSSINESNYKTHILNNHSSREERKENFSFYCEKCDFGCLTNSSFELHLKTKKHNMKTN